MREISVREANQNFSRVIADAENGETIIITKHGVLVASIVPQPADRSADPRWRAAYDGYLGTQYKYSNLDGAKARQVTAPPARSLVPQVGLEPTRPHGQQILSLPRLPFRHWGSGRTL